MHVSPPKKTRCVRLHTYQSAELSSNRLAQVAQKSVPPPCGRFKIADRGEKRPLCSEKWQNMALEKEKTPRAAPTLSFCLRLKSPRMAENGNYREENAFSPLFLHSLGSFALLVGGCFPQMVLIFWVLSDLFGFFAFFIAFHLF